VVMRRDEWACRKFYAYGQDGTMLAFIFFLPCFRDGKVSTALDHECHHRPTPSWRFVARTGVQAIGVVGI
jgi:hypothetical protein